MKIFTASLIKLMMRLVANKMVMGVWRVKAALEFMIDTRILKILTASYL